MSFDKKLNDLLPDIHFLKDCEDLNDFLLVFSPTLDHIKELIDNFPKLSDIDSCPEKYLSKLGDLLGYKYDNTRDPELQRQLIKFRIEFYRRKGSLASLSRIFDENKVVGEIKENYPVEGEFLITANNPPDFLPRLIEEIHPAGTKWNYFVRWICFSRNMCGLRIAVAKKERRSGQSRNSGCGYAVMRSI